MAIAAEPVAHDSVTLEWLQSVLSGAGYEISVLPGLNNEFVAKKTGTFNRGVRLVPKLSILSIRSGWSTKGGYGNKKHLVEAVQKANSSSFMHTFYLDGNDLWVSSCLFLTDHVSAADIQRFFATDEVSLLSDFATSELGKLLN